MKVLSQKNNEKRKVYVELLEEGTDTWRPTYATLAEDDLWILMPTDDYDPEDESWAFLPGQKVCLEEQQTNGETRYFVAHSDERAIRVHVQSANGLQKLYLTHARLIRDDLYEILPTPQYSAATHNWEFPPGSIVHIIEKYAGDQKYLLAIAV